VIEEAAVVLCGEEAERDPEPDGEDQRRERELDRRRKAVLDLVRDQPVRGDRGAEVALRPGPELAPILFVDRFVEPEALPVGLHELRRRALAEQGLGRPARQRADPEEDEQREPEGDRDEKQQPADDVTKHFYVVRRPAT
jgi:hypothetical protein